jgi:HAD superfamily hydrolase (TIGR01549 family)
MKKVFIFDMDGVLVDSEPIYLGIHKSYFESLGIFMTDEDIHKLTGMTARRIYSDAKEKYNLTETVDNLINNELKIIESHFESLTGLVPVEGIPETLEKLKSKNITVGLASSNTRSMINILTRKTDIAGYFDFMISGEDVSEGKPNPEIFLKVAEHFGESPDDCLVIEDSFNGVTAAKKAGMYCVGYRNPNSGNQNISAADLIINHFEELHTRI